MTEHNSPIAVLLINLGSPDAPTAPAIARYLREFLSDRRVVDLPKWLWSPILNGIILRRRPERLVPLYEMIWNHEVAPENGAPLKAITLIQANALQDYFTQHHLNNLRVYWAMRYQNPSIGTVLQQIAKDGITRVVVLPLYPQYSLTTTETALEEFQSQIASLKIPLTTDVVREYHQHPSYIQALTQSIQAHWQTHGQPDFANGDKLLLSFHGIPERNTRLGDPYQAQCEGTYHALAAALDLPKNSVLMSYQSRFGAQKWLQPYSSDMLTQLAKSGTRRIDVLCPGFSADCLETLEEVAHQLKAVFLDNGGQRYHYIPCLNDSNTHIEMMALLTQHILHPEKN